ncbi:hypothetical protein L245_16260 [Salmonella enterica subsp. enterica serovar Worthington str. BCH-4719]|nr:hypothetical protein L245_16260 [Salmonella enterica subsp. enterica serovar Worthington str. BCH-4719]
MKSIFLTILLNNILHSLNRNMQDIVQEYRQFLMYSYRDDEYNFYAEAHLPKIKQVQDKKTLKTDDTLEQYPS